MNSSVSSEHLVFTDIRLRADKLGKLRREVGCIASVTLLCPYPPAIQAGLRARSQTVRITYHVHSFSDDKTA